MILAREFTPGDALICLNEGLALIIGITVNPSNSSKLRFFLFMPDGRIYRRQAQRVTAKRDASAN